MNTKIRVAGVLAALAIVVAACGGGGRRPSPAASGPAASAAGRVARRRAVGARPRPRPPLSGELTIWHSYGSGGGETGAFNTILDDGHGGQPRPDGQRRRAARSTTSSTSGETDVAAGGGADMFIAPNDSLGQDAREESSRTSTSTSPATPRSRATCRSPSTARRSTASFYMVPESLKAVALWYDKSADRDAADRRPDELLAGVKDGSIKLGVEPGRLPPVRLDRRLRRQAHGRHRQVHRRRRRLRRRVQVPAGPQGRGRDLQHRRQRAQDRLPDRQDRRDHRRPVADRATSGRPSATSSPSRRSRPAPTAAANPFTGTDGWYINPNLDPEQASSPSTSRSR